MGYLRFPTIHGETVIFGCEDDLWSVPAEGGRAWRLTAGVAEATSPMLSPDGTQVAFLGGDEGPFEVYVMPAEGGDPRRLTFDGVGAEAVAGWTRGEDGGQEIVYASSVGRPFPRDVWLHKVAASGGA
ncbi:MAG TPA: peptidase, partial [Actinopolymorphaceae bacterium]